MNNVYLQTLLDLSASLTSCWFARNLSTEMSSIDTSHPIPIDCIMGIDNSGVGEVWIFKGLEVLINTFWWWIWETSFLNAESLAAEDLLLRLMFSSRWECLNPSLGTLIQGLNLKPVSTTGVGIFLPLFFFGGRGGKAKATEYLFAGLLDNSTKPVPRLLETRAARCAKNWRSRMEGFVGYNSFGLILMILWWWSLLWLCKKQLSCHLLCVCGGGGSSLGKSHECQWDVISSSSSWTDQGHWLLLGVA